MTGNHRNHSLPFKQPYWVGFIHGKVSFIKTDRLEVQINSMKAFLSWVKDCIRFGL